MNGNAGNPFRKDPDPDDGPHHLSSTNKAAIWLAVVAVIAVVLLWWMAGA